MKAQVTLSNDRIEAIEIDAPYETDSLTAIAREALPQLIVASQSLGVDCISGATITSLAVVEAVSDCVRQAGGDPEDLKNREVILPEATSALPSGTYTGESFGMWGRNAFGVSWFGAADEIKPTKVEVKVADNRIASVKVMDCSDTAGFKEGALERIPQAIVDNQSLAVDVVSGATMSSGAVRAAAMRALQEAGADLAPFAVKPAKAPADPETYDCDLLVIGAGTAGTTAALRGVELGLNVVVADVAHRVSGAGGTNTGPLGVDSSMHRAAGFTDTPDSVFTRMMEESK